MNADPNTWWSKENLRGLPALMREPYRNFGRLSRHQRYRLLLLIGAVIAAESVAILLILLWLKRFAS